MTRADSFAIVLAAAAALHLTPAGAQQKPAAAGQEMGCRRRSRADDEARVRHDRRHVDERRRQPGRQADRVRPARRHLHDADRRQRPRAGDPADERPGVRHAAALQPRRQAHRLRQRSRRPLEHLDDGRRRQGRRSRSRASAGGSSTARPGRPTASTSTRAGTSSRSARSAPARSGCTTRRARRTACRSPSGPAGRRTTASPTSRPTAATSITARTSRPGQTFEYNKDPNGTIYAIMRRDLVTGRERRAVSVQGGSVTPQVSPDGKTLAYIRRVRLKSVLYLRDLDSGRDRELFEQRRQGPAGSVGRARPLSAVRVDAGRHGRSSSGARARSGRSTSPRARARRSRSPRASSRRSTRRCASRRRCTPTSSRCGCCATCASRRTARRSSTARSASSTRARCRTASRAASRRTTGSSSSRRSRATASGSST